MKILILQKHRFKIMEETCSQFTQWRPRSSRYSQLESVSNQSLDNLRVHKLPRIFSVSKTSRNSSVETEEIMSQTNVCYDDLNKPCNFDCVIKLNYQKFNQKVLS